MHRRGKGLRDDYTHAVMAQKYRMLAIDLDGTLLNSAGRVSRTNIKAIERALEAGMMVVPCTGRGWPESRLTMQQLPPLDMGVFVTGAVINDVRSGQPHELAVVEPNLALNIVNHLSQLPEAVLVFRDKNVVGHDYLVTGQGALTGNTQWWFQHARLTVSFCDQPTLDDMHHVLRLGVVAVGHRMEEIGPEVEKAFGEQIYMHSFPGVPMPDPDETIHVLEVFSKGVDKWRGLSWVAEQHDIASQQVIAIGDSINDHSMIDSAGLSIAMGNAIEPLKAKADHTTLHHDEDGVAHAIDRVLAGEWG